jgi:hypothetical protein
MGARNTFAIEVSEMIVLVYNMPKERQDFFFQRVAMVGQATPDKARDRMIIGSRQGSYRARGTVYQGGRNAFHLPADRAAYCGR